MRRARRRRMRRSGAASASAGANTRSRSAAGTSRRPHAAASGIDDAGLPGTVLVDGVAVERAGGGPCRVAARRQGITALLDDLAADDLLVVGAGHEAGVLEARHHLVER